MLGKRRPPRTSEKRSSPSSVVTGQAQGIEILRLAHDGRGVARSDNGKTLFVERALPGERVSVAVHRSRRRFDEAHLRDVHLASPERVTPACDHFARCGGCDLQHMAPSAQRNHKQAVLVEQLERQHLTLPRPPSMLADASLGYRRRARLGVKVDAQGQVHVGFREAGSHHLVDIVDCPILVPALSSLLPSLSACLASLDAPHLVGHVELLDSDDGACVVVRQLRPHPGDERRWQSLAASRGFHLAWRSGRDTPTLIWNGDVSPELYYRLDSGQTDVKVGFEPGDFLQVHAGVNQQLIDTILEWVMPDLAEGHVLDLFAGIGNVSLALAVHAAEVTAVEGQQAMVDRLMKNARANGLDNIDARQADLMDDSVVSALLTASSRDLVILDPPREGAEAVCRHLAQKGPARVLYVSCDPATLARDAAHLVHGGYRIVASAVADMFAQTSHLESVLLFESVQARP
ncbi:RsmD family RNA methyltransferase [Aidingimonas halophila]|nr:RsmD family RNA methyltransferase [Aidingimonas halophila]